MGENRRYDRSGRLDAATEAEVRALRAIAGLIEGGTRLITDRAVAGQLGEVLRTAATELASGRALPIPVRRAVRHLADGIRAALDPPSRCPSDRGIRLDGPPHRAGPRGRPSGFDQAGRGLTVRASQERALAQRRADQERLVTVAAALRHSATQTGYAGTRGTYVGYAISALLEDPSRVLEQVPDLLRRDALAVARFQLDGPDGPNDPRTAGRSALSDGPGH